LVASPGLEPGLSALRGRRVNQLHHDARTGRNLSVAIDKIIAGLEGIFVGMVEENRQLEKQQSVPFGNDCKKDRDKSSFD
jgi:hypothetical protein